MEIRIGRGYAWAIAAGFMAALAAISAKFFSSQVIKYGFVILFNVTMWGCYVNSLKSLSSLQATVTNFATNFLTSGLAGFFLFDESLRYQISQNSHEVPFLVVCRCTFHSDWRANSQQIKY
ncbi:uncharacterized protein LOC104456688 isoform X1 [Eucalyptus grandis]|uniref:uncharacterized protein LOC104456688 isoform X1 n=1 Tax=Eucalyptus grandis TaxID=71139 RepID=UPI0005265F41|nr:uncharacterized protein LOC104456688 isoform X1 [Eucalyptus grandis]